MTLFICYGKYQRDKKANQDFLVVAERPEDVSAVMKDAGFGAYLPPSMVRAVFGVKPDGVSRVVLTI